jgi:hypothetical protein
MLQNFINHKSPGFQAPVKRGKKMNKIPQKNAIILYDQKDGLVTDFLVLYKFNDEELKEEGCPGNSYVEMKYDQMHYNSGNVYSDWAERTPAYIIFDFLICLRFASSDYFLRAFDELMKINEVRESLESCCDKTAIYTRIENTAFAERFPWARRE